MPDSLSQIRVFLTADIGFTMEYFCPGGKEMYRHWIKDDYQRMLRPPPWG